ncbi:MAG: SDR family NAD(P)-dependent oxidoreductase [Quadrisphaera sp.]
MSPEALAPRPVTVVTGAGRGIGAATAELLAQLGHDLVLGHLSDRTAVDVVAGAARAQGAEVVVVRGDVRDPATADLLFDAAGDLGQVTGLVNNAGLTAHLGDLADTPVEVITRVVETNLLGAIWCARRAAQVMSTARGGLVLQP